MAPLSWRRAVGIVIGAVAVSVIAVVLGIAGFRATLRWHTASFEPPTSVVDAESYLAWQPDASIFHASTCGGRRVLRAAGPRFRWLGSGPPVYVFDDSGRLVDWTIDALDDPAFDRRQGRCEGSERLARDEARRWGNRRLGPGEGEPALITLLGWPCPKSESSRTERLCTRTRRRGS